jgi:serine/threonine protein kinase
MRVPAQDEDQPRRIGGRYRLSALLGSGAMGTVWSGYDEVLQRRIAVKELKIPPGVPAREALDMRERIMREARALGGLSHPNIITVFDVVVVDDAPVVVLEMVPSRDLATMIAEHGALSEEQAAVIGFTTAGALRAAHRSGITHRDIKPGNVLVADDGRVKLTDFGIARNVADAPMTSAGLVLGSPAYIAPEVAAGQPVTPAADLWGLGATLFAAVEGRPPYDVQGDPVRTITEVVDGDVPKPRTTGPVADVIAALMVKDPAGRMALEDVRRRLRPLILDPDDPVYPGSPDAPTMAAPIQLPDPGARPGAPRLGTPRPAGSSPIGSSPAGSSPARPSPSDAGRAGGPAPPQRAGSPSPVARRSASLAADPGPLPGAAPAAHRSAPLTADPGPLPGGRPLPPPGPPSPKSGPPSIAGRQPNPDRPKTNLSKSGRPNPKRPSPGQPSPGPSIAGPSTPGPQSPGLSHPGPAAPGPANPGQQPNPAPLAAAPGPLPPGIRPDAAGRADPRPPTSTGPSGWVAAGLVAAGAAVVLAGIAAGWVATRTVSGQSPWTTVTVSTPDSR